VIGVGADQQAQARARKEATPARITLALEGNAAAGAVVPGAAISTSSTPFPR